MIIFPAIDLYDKKAVRLYKGNYDQMTVYNDNPSLVAKDFEKMGATHIHLVDLEGAKDGSAKNLETIKDILDCTNLFAELGGGIRNLETVKRYIDIGIDRIILGTAAVKDEEFLLQAVDKYKEKIAVGIDIKDGFVAISGWTEKSSLSAFDFCEKMEKIGISNIICTDISKDGAMMGTNLNLYKELSQRFSVNITASGGVSSIDDVKNLRELDLYGAIIGKAYYIGAIDLKEAIEVAK